jgi:hypothetical protein
MFCSEFWAYTFCFLVQYPLLRADEFSGSSGRQSLPIHDEGDVLILCEGDLQGDYHSHSQVCFGLIRTDAAFGQFPFISLWNSLCSHTDTLTQSQDLGWGFGELEVACDQTMSQVFIMQINILLDFFIADMGALEAVFSHWCDSTSYSITVRIPHSYVFGCQPLILALFVCLWAGKGFVNLHLVRMQLFEKKRKPKLI